MIFQQIRNACIKIKYHDLVFMIDPWLSDAAEEEEIKQAVQAKQFITKPVVPLPSAVEEIIADTNVFLVSHDHADHFSADYLPKDGRMIFQNEKDAELGKSLGFTNTDWFREDVMTFGEVTVYRTEGRHGDTDALAQKAGPVSGFVFTRPNEKTVWVAGDTVYYDSFPEVIHMHHPDVIIVNACDARTRSGRLIMNTEDVIKTCACAPDSLIIASHMDAVSHAHLSRAQLRKELSASPYAKQVLIPEDGEEIVL